MLRIMLAKSNYFSPDVEEVSVILSCFCVWQEQIIQQVTLNQKVKVHVLNWQRKKPKDWSIDVKCHWQNAAYYFLVILIENTFLRRNFCPAWAVIIGLFS